MCSGQLSLLPSAGRKISSSSYCGLWGEGLVWLVGAVVCLLAAPWVQLSVSAGNGWPHNALRHHGLMPISCHFWDCKALLVTSLTDVSGAIIGVQTFTFTFIILISSQVTTRAGDTVPGGGRYQNTTPNHQPIDESLYVPMDGRRRQINKGKHNTLLNFRVNLYIKLLANFEKLANLLQIWSLR